MMAGEPFVLCENLIKIYRLTADGQAGGHLTEVQALQGLDLSVLAGEMIGVVGASGSGKSTLLNILGGLDRPTGGRVVVDGKDLGRLSQRALDEYRRTTVGFVWQYGGRNLIPYLSARENITLPLLLAGQAGRAAQQRAGELLEIVGLGTRAAHRLDELSGGEQQRVAIAIALANRPRLLLADEPTGELDNATAQVIYDLFRQLNRQLTLTIIIVSHDVNLSRHVDRVVAVRDGKLASETVRRPVSRHDEAQHFEELVVLDAAGRLQVPREYLEQFHIHRRARLEVTPQGILIRPPAETQTPEQQGSIPSPVSPSEETAAPSEAGEAIPVLVRWGRRAVSGLTSLLRRRHSRQDHNATGGV
jgi:ABC-type lipoprotein export system ATPase subunit